jgi:UDP-hydrolysing UDP-N-acetyl-D-glucosamine 2-epimerase
MSKRKICVVLTARASYAKIQPILKAIAAHPALELQIVCAASAVLERYGSTDLMVERDGFTINERIYMVLEAETLLTSAKSAGIGIGEFAGAFDRLKPDVVLVMADRYEVLSAAVAASYLNIPLAHAQGGEVSGNIDEKVRHAITKLADIHFPATQRAKDWIIRMGENADMVFHTGCPSIDIAAGVLKEPAINFDLFDRYRGVGNAFNLSNGYLIVMQHPVTTEATDARTQIEQTLKAVNRLDKPTFWFWPNADAGGDLTAKGIRVFREHHPDSKIYFVKNMQPQDFLRLANGSDGIVGNSSSAIRECSFMGIPAVNIGSRQMNRERGPNVLDVGYDSEEIYNAIVKHCTGKKEPVKIYGEGNAAKKIADILSSVKLGITKSLNYNNPV